MRAKYCFDTSAFSTPYSDDHLPEKVFPSVWGFVKTKIENGSIVVNREIFNELVKADGDIYQHIKDNKNNILLEVKGNWDWGHYISIVESLKSKYENFICEYTEAKPNKTITFNDLSIVCLAKTLKLPLVSSETIIDTKPNTKWRKIPNICGEESIEHLTFNEFLINEGVSF